jgi:hypothetical protein
LRPGTRKESISFIVIYWRRRGDIQGQRGFGNEAFVLSSYNKESRKKSEITANREIK